jgi:hypothetical protein
LHASFTVDNEFLSDNILGDERKTSSYAHDRDGERDTIRSATYQNAATFHSEATDRVGLEIAGRSHEAGRF